MIEDKEGGADFVEDVGLPPQLPNKRTIRAIDARTVSFHFLSRIAELVTLDCTFLQSSSDKFEDNDKERC